MREEVEVSREDGKYSKAKTNRTQVICADDQN